MKIKENVKKILGWMVKGFAIVAVPAMFPASVGMGQRVGWVGAVLVWIYMGRIMKQAEE
ncbi:MAG: hypothetical protein ACK2T7_05870 [Anaerolineales bacterium]